MTDQIILFFLFIFSLRDIITSNINIPKDKKWSWLFYNRNQCEQIPPCYQLNKINKNKTPIKYKSDLLTRLIIVLGKHTKYFEEGAYCDRKKTLRVHYLVSTLEASHDDDDLVIMTDVIQRMYFDLCSKKQIDFVISLKGGNVLLVNNFFQSRKTDLVHLTYNRNLFFESFDITNSNTHDYEMGKSLKFENIQELMRIASLNKRKLNGIILDCSYSSGEGIVQYVKEFNSLINDKTKDNLNINPIQEVRVIYSHVGKDIRKKLNDLNCNIDYLFSLDDDIRKQLYELIYQEQQEYVRYNNATTILEQLKKKHLLNESLII